MRNVRVWLSTLWIFMLLNYLYCDVVGLYDPTLAPNLSDSALLAASFLMEIPIAMVLLSLVLKPRPNRWVNLIAGTFMAVVQVWSLSVGKPAVYYLFFSAIEIACLLFIVWNAWKWEEPARVAAIA